VLRAGSREPKADIEVTKKGRAQRLLRRPFARRANSGSREPDFYKTSIVLKLLPH
jgi:hypothetical protein